MERRLAAILAADVVGYSRLMGVDEVGVFGALKALRSELFDPQVEKHRGRIVKLMGDGTLVEFASVVDAVDCATGIQTELAKRNDDLPPEERLELRIQVFADAVSARRSGRLIAALQRKSPKQSLKASFRREMQTALSLAARIDYQERDFLAIRAEKSKRQLGAPGYLLARLRPDVCFGVSAQVASGSDREWSGPTRKIGATGHS